MIELREDGVAHLAQRVEMGVVSRDDHEVSIGDARIRLQEGEFIHIENSHKYSLESFAALAESADLVVSRVWTDPQDLFSVQLLEHA